MNEMLDFLGLMLGGQYEGERFVGILETLQQSIINQNERDFSSVHRNGSCKHRPRPANRARPHPFGRQEKTKEYRNRGERGCTCDYCFRRRTHNSVAAARGAELDILDWEICSKQEEEEWHRTIENAKIVRQEMLLNVKTTWPIDDIPNCSDLREYISEYNKAVRIARSALS